MPLIAFINYLFDRRLNVFKDRKGCRRLALVFGISHVHLDLHGFCQGGSVRLTFCIVFSIIIKCMYDLFGCGFLVNLQEHV